MAIRGKKPSEIPQRLKGLFYGDAGVGKTMAAIHFPKPYLIDAEDSSNKKQYAKKIEEGEGAVFQTTDFDDMLREVESLLTEKHEYKTLIIDSMSVFYDQQTNLWASKLADDKDPTGTAFGRHKMLPGMKMKALLNLLTRLDMNIIIITHSKTKWLKEGKNEMIDGGQTFDCYEKLKYFFDLMLQIEKRGGKRFAVVTKSRLENFIEGKSIDITNNPDEIMNIHGREIIEKEAEPQVVATEEQVKTIKHLIKITNTNADIVQKWKDKAKANDFEDMPINVIQSCIEYLNKKLAPAA